MKWLRAARALGTLSHMAAIASLVLVAGVLVWALVTPGGVAVDPGPGQLCGRPGPGNLTIADAVEWFFGAGNACGVDVFFYGLWALVAVAALAIAVGDLIGVVNWLKRSALGLLLCVDGTYLALALLALLLLNPLGEWTLITWLAAASALLGPLVGGSRMARAVLASEALP